MTRSTYEANGKTICLGCNWPVRECACPRLTDRPRRRVKRTYDTEDGAKRAMARYHVRDEDRIVFREIIDGVEKFTAFV